MSEEAPRIIHFSSMRLDSIRITEQPGWTKDRIQAEIGPFRVWMDEDKNVHVADSRGRPERILPLVDAFRFGGGLIVDDPEAFCSAETMTEAQRAAAIWAGAYLLIEGSRFMMLDPEPAGSADGAELHGGES
ncbi:MAG: hypothetical protein ACFB9M_00475 [Myxococcota bacterium]